MDNGNCIVLNEGRGVRVCGTVMSAINNREYLFSDPKTFNYMNPENKLLSAINPDREKDKTKKAFWLFLTIIADKLTDSTRLYSRLAEFYEKHPDFFDLEKLMKTEIDMSTELKNGLGKVVHHPNQFIDNVKSNYVKLLSEYGPNPLKLFDENDNCESAIKKLKKFKGYDEGIASLLLLFYSKYNIIDIQGLGPKADRHKIRISESCGVYERKGNPRVDNVSRQLSSLLRKICTEERINAGMLDAGLWVIGSRVCVRKSTGYCRVFCPLDNLCNKIQPITDKKNTRLYDPPRERKTQQLLPLNFSSLVGAG